MIVTCAVQDSVMGTQDSGFCAGGGRAVWIWELIILQWHNKAQQSQVRLISPGPDYLMITTSSEVDFLLCFPRFLYKGMI